MKTTTKHASNSPVTFVTHKRFVVLFFLPSCCVHSLRSLISRRLQGKTPLCRPFFETLQFWWRNALNGEKKTFSFQNYPGTCGRTLSQTISFSLFLLCMTEIVTTWRRRRIGAQILKLNWPMADRQPESTLAISFAVVFPCQLHAHFGLSTDVFYFLCETTK